MCRSVNDDAWKTMNAQEQRVRFVVAASRGEGPFSRLFAEFEISRPTGLPRVERYREAEPLIENASAERKTLTRIGVVPPAETGELENLRVSLLVCP